MQPVGTAHSPAPAQVVEAELQLGKGPGVTVPQMYRCHAPPGRAALGAVTELGSRGQQCRVPPHTIQRLLGTAPQGQTPPHVPEAPQTGAGPTGKWRQGQQHGHSPVPESQWPCLPPGAAEQPQPPGPSPGTRQPHLLQLRGHGERGQRLRGGSGGRGGCGHMSGRIRGRRLQSL